VLTINFDHIHLKQNDILLDLGCGEGRHSIGVCFYYPESKVIALDVSFKDLTTAKTRHSEHDEASAKNCLYTQANGYRLPFAENTFDHIICSEVLEHVLDYHRFFAEIYRVLKPGGTLNVSVPRYWPEKICWALSREYYNVEGGHIRIFQSKELREEIQGYRFIFRRRHWAHSLHVPYWWLRCAFWRHGEKFFLTRWYHRLLIWDMLKRPLITQVADRFLNPIMGKSVVMYFYKPEDI